MSGYRDDREIVRTTAREHSALVEAVLAGPTSREPSEVAQALRLPLESHFLVVAAESVEATTCLPDRAGTGGARRQLGVAASA